MRSRSRSVRGLGGAAGPAGVVRQRDVQEDPDDEGDVGHHRRPQAQAIPAERGGVDRGELGRGEHADEGEDPHRDVAAVAEPPGQYVAEADAERSGDGGGGQLGGLHAGPGAGQRFDGERGEVQTRGLGAEDDERTAEDGGHPDGPFHPVGGLEDHGDAAPDEGEHRTDEQDMQQDVEQRTDHSPLPWAGGGPGTPDRARP
ncbi:hypothetical protein OG607_44090 [Streptomyces sp. NBC_01537]|uniref:hypothetical protein n=1 Tax=Streptomyces sp. NBC_01537 TaxID=2903896 RepID=UPI003869464C